MRTLIKTPKSKISDLWGVFFPLSKSTYTSGDCDLPERLCLDTERLSVFIKLTLLHLRVPEACEKVASDLGLDDGFSPGTTVLDAIWQ